MEFDFNDYFIDNMSQIIGILKYWINAANLGNSNYLEIHLGFPKSKIYAIIL
jgi:hypothetical protein